MNNTDDQILAYLNGEMTEEDKSEFEAVLQKDESLQKQLILIKVLQDDLDRARVIRHLRDKPAPVITLNRRFIKPLMLAAGVVLLAGLGLLFIKNKESQPDSLFYTYYEKPLRLPAMKMGSLNPHSFLNHCQYAMASYASGDYETTLANLTKLKARFANNDSLQFYLGICYIELGQPDSAAFYFDKLLLQSSGEYKDASGWYRLLVYLQEEKPDEAAVFIQRKMPDNQLYKATIEEIKQALSKRENEEFDD